MSIIKPPLVISSINTGTDEITFSAPHGLTTGDPFLVVYSPNGGTLPAPLAPVTHYWFIRVSDTVGKLALSSTDAMALTAIDLTTAGSGTLQVLRGMPYSIPAIVVGGSQLNPDHIQSAFESIEALWALLTGQAQAIWSTILIALNVTLTANQHFTVSGTGKFKHGTKTIPVIVQPNASTAPAIGGVNMLGLASYYAIQGVPVGARLLGARVTVIDSATGPTKLTLSFAFVDCSTPSSPSAGAAGTGSQSTGSGTSQNIATAAVTLTTTTGQNWYLLVNTATGAATCKVIAAEVDYDQP